MAKMSFLSLILNLCVIFCLTNLILSFYCCSYGVLYIQFFNPEILLMQLDMAYLPFKGMF